MNEFLSAAFFMAGIIFVIAGKPFLEVAACFLICGIFSGCAELHLIREELEDFEE